MKEPKITIIDDSNEPQEIDVQVLNDNYATDTLEKIVSSDPFAAVDVTKESGPVKRKYNELKKTYMGVDGAGSKYIDPEVVWGYSLYNVVEPPYNLEALAQLYDTNAVLHAVVDSRVMNTVGLGFDWQPTLKAQKQIEKGTKSSDAAQRVRSVHQKEKEMLNELFDSMNAEESFLETMMRVWLDTLTLGNGYLEVGRTANGKIGYLGHVPGTLVRVRRPRDGFVQKVNQNQKAVFFRHFGDTTTVDPIGNDKRPNELIHFKLYTPNSTYYGVPPSVSALPSLIGDKFAKEFNIDYFENKAIPRYAIVLKGVKLSEVSKRELVNYFRNEVKGKNHGTLVVPIPQTVGGVDADIRFEKLEADIQDSSFEKYMRSNRDTVISAYRVPPTKVGVLDNANLAVSRDADKTFKSQVVGPDQVVAEKKINRIVSEFTDLFNFKFNQLDVIDEDLKSRIYDRYARIEVMTPNEIRQAIGMQSRDGGDEILPFPVKNNPSASGGAPFGNSNSHASSPPKSGQDNGTNVSPAQETGGTNERGQTQDQQGIKDNGGN